jgi:very-short-patch-repair endonuclease
LRGGISTTKQARSLRRNATDAERILWRGLRYDRLGWRFRRQHSIPPYIVDFACIEARLIVEADGGQHAESSGDRVRNAYLHRRGWRILRFWNNDIIENPEGVLQAIAAALGPHPSPPPRAGEGGTRVSGRVGAVQSEPRGGGFRSPGSGS